MDKELGIQYHQWHESLEEMNDWCNHHIRLDRNLRLFEERVTNRKSSNGSWFGIGCSTAADVLHRLEHGWPKYEALVTNVASNLEASLTLETVTAMTMEVRKRKRRWLDQGDTLDMHRVWGGDLDHAWQRPVRYPKMAPTQRYATIFIDTATSAMKTAEDGVWRAATAVRICDLLTTAGISTEIWCGASSLQTYEGRLGSQAWFATKVKEYQQPINLNRVAGLSSVGAHRTVSFKMKCAGPYQIEGHFGMPYESGLPLPLRERLEAGERVVRIGNCWSMRDAVAQVAKVAKDLASGTSTAEISQ